MSHAELKRALQEHGSFLPRYATKDEMVVLLNKILEAKHAGPPKAFRK